MSQAELPAWLESRDAHWCSQYQAAPAQDEESEIVAQFLATPYPYQTDDGGEQEQKRGHEMGEVSATYWPEPAGAGAGYWPPSNDDTSNSSGSGSGAYFDGTGCCYYYLAEPDVSLGINTLTTLPCASSIDLNLLGDGEEERSARVQPVPPNPSPTDHIHTTDRRSDGNGVSQPKRKAPAGRDGEDLGRPKKKARAPDNKQEKKAASASKTARNCSQESTQQSRGSCSGDESNCSEVNRHSGAGGGGNAKARAAKGSTTDPQSLFLNLIPRVSMQGEEGRGSMRGSRFCRNWCLMEPKSTSVPCWRRQFTTSGSCSSRSRC